MVRRFAPAHGLSRKGLADDARRVETWLAHQGFFEARITGWRIDRQRPRRFRRDGTLRKAGVVDLAVQVDLGPRSLVRSVKVAWQDDEADRIWRSAQARTVARTGAVQEGLPFSLESATYTRDDLLARIRNHGHGHGEVEIRVDAYPEEQVVDVVFEATTGPPTTISEVVIEGNEDVQTSDIQEVVRLKAGEPTSQSALDRAQQELVSLGVFTVARVDPELSDPEASEIPVRVEVTESRFGRIRAGSGIVYNGTTISPRLSTEITHNNLDGRLMHLDAGANLGLGIPLLGGIEASQILGGFNVGVNRPRAFGPKWDTNAELRFQRDLVSGQLLQQRAGLRAGLAHRFTDSVSLNIGLSPELVRLGSGSLVDFGVGDLSRDDRLLAAATFGLTGSALDEGLATSFLLTTAEARLTIDWRQGAFGKDIGLDPRGGLLLCRRDPPGDPHRR